MAPTYELALQIGEVTKQMSKFMRGVSVVFAVRGADGQLSHHVLVMTYYSQLTVVACIFQYQTFGLLLHTEACSLQNKPSGRLIDRVSSSNFSTMTEDTSMKFGSLLYLSVRMMSMLLLYIQRLYFL